MIMVDELRRHPGAARLFIAGSCHLTTDGSLDDLHAFAARIDCRRAWFQAHPLHPHYDLTPGRRAAALLAGATFVSAKDQARARLRARGVDV